MNTNVSGPIKGVLSRSEMKQILAGSGPTDPADNDESTYYLTCSNCNNDSCRGYIDSCSISDIWPVCGSHDTGWTCVEV